MASRYFLVLITLCSVTYFIDEVKACGGFIQQTTGVITSPRYPSEYPPNQQCTWEIKTTPGRRIEIHFRDIVMESSSTCSYDYMTIRSKLANGTIRDHGRYCTFPGYTILSDSNNVLIDFRSDSSNQFRGFKVEFYSSVFSECGEVITDSKGTITSPQYNRTYPPNMDCTWTIQAPQNHLVKLDFKKFSLEPHDKCLFDYVTIRSKIEDELLDHGKFCGSEVPPVIVSDSNVLLIHFVSDRSNEFGGFLANFSFAYGGSFRQTSGVITSPGYPSKYPPNSECIWKIGMPLNIRIGLHFKHFRVEGNNRDYLTIRSKLENGTLLEHGKYDKHPNDTIVSESNILFIEFVSDGSTEYEGFELHFHSVYSQCGGVITDNNGIVTSPQYQHNRSYPPDMDCTWTIQAPLNHIVKLNFEKFSLELHENCSFDYVAIRSKLENGDTREHGKFCGSEVPPSIFSDSRVLLIQFVSDKSSGYSGFLSNFSFAHGSFIEQTSGVITSPGYPSKYPPNYEYLWQIMMPSNNRIGLHFKHFRLEGNNNDYLTIRSKLENGTFLQHGKYGTLPKDIIVSENNILFIHFVSDGSTEYEGFELEFFSVKCGGLIEENVRFITSPQKNFAYLPDMNCTWTIQAPLSNSIKLNFKKFSLEPQDNCSFDYVTVKNKMADGELRELGKFCGFRVPPVLISESNVLLVQFVSDRSKEYNGFLADFSFEKCGGLIEGRKGNISTPFYPNSYPPNQTCEWIILVPPQHKLKLRFLDFEIEEGGDDCSNDYLLTLIESEDGLHKYEKYCGSSGPSFIYSNDTIHLKFVSDHSYQKKGFKAEYVIDKSNELSTSMKKSTPSRYIPEKSLTAKKYEDNQRENAISIMETNNMPVRRYLPSKNAFLKKGGKKELQFI